MAIRINLLAEEQAAEEMRRKNPVKLAIWLGSFLVALVLIWILKLQLDIGFSNKHKSTVEQSLKDSMAMYAAVTNNMTKTSEAERKLAALDRLATNRFFWAPLLNALQQTMIDDIQIVKMTGEQRYVKEDPVVLGTGANKIVRPGSMIEKISLSLDAKDFNPNALNYDKFTEKLRACDYFAKHLDPRYTFALDGTLGPPSVDPSDPTRQFVVFKLVARFKDVKRD